MPAKTKTCPTCGKDLPVAQFSKAAKARDGLQSKCRACFSAYLRAYHQANKARLVAGRVERAKAFAMANPDEMRARSQRYYASNPEVHRERSRQWRASNPEATREQHRRRRARLREASLGPVDVESLWTGSCGLCGDVMDRAIPSPHPLSPTIDHIIPLARGGAHAQDNLQWAHRICNTRKGARTPN